MGASAGIMRRAKSTSPVASPTANHAAFLHRDDAHWLHLLGLNLRRHTLHKNDIMLPAVAVEILLVDNTSKEISCEVWKAMLQVTRADLASDLDDKCLSDMTAILYGGKYHDHPGVPAALLLKGLKKSTSVKTEVDFYGTPTKCLICDERHGVMRTSVAREVLPHIEALPKFEDGSIDFDKLFGPGEEEATPD